MMFSPEAPKIWPETLAAAGAVMATEKRLDGQQVKVCHQRSINGTPSFY